MSRGYATDSNADVDAVMKDVMGWLARPDNSAWLLVVDAIAYDVRRYSSGSDHGICLDYDVAGKAGQDAAAARQGG